MSPIRRGPEDQRRVLLRKARAFAARGEDHLAELHINHALECRTPLDEVNAALDDLGPRGSGFTRREALRRASVLVGAGVLLGPEVLRTLTGAPARQVEDPDAQQLVAAGTETGITGVFLTVPSSQGDGTYSVVPVGGGGLGASLGTYSGHTLVDGGVAYNVSQSWGSGTVVTDVTVLDATGPIAHFALSGGGTTQGASTTESVTTATKVGSLLYCSHTWLRITIGPGHLGGKKAGTPVVRLTSQPTLQVIDVTSGGLAAAWTGPVVAGACRASLKVSSDGTGILLATDTPGVPDDVRSLHLFRLQGTTLSPLASPSASASASAMVGLLGRDYRWPSADAPVVGVSGSGIHQFSPADQRQSTTELPVQYGNNRLPPLWQGTFLADGNPVVGSGDGRLFHQDGEAATSLRQATLSGTTVSPPYLVYQGSQMEKVFATAGDALWMVDNREGVGGVWRLDQQLQPLDHQLAGNYCSSIVADSTGTSVACLSPLESVVYILGPNATVGAFATPQRAKLVQGSQS